MLHDYIRPGCQWSPSGTLRFETRRIPAPARRKKLIWWLPDNSAPGLTAASLNHAEYQRRALPVKEKRKAVVMTQNNTTISEDGMVKIRLHQCRKYTGWHENGPARGVDIFSPEHPE